MEESEKIENLNDLKIQNTNYFDFENRLKETLNSEVERQFNNLYAKLSDKERLLFNDKIFTMLKVNWIFNINHIQNNRGDLSSSSLQKFFHHIFINEKEEVENEADKFKKDEFINFKNTFQELFTVSFSLVLNSSEFANQLDPYVGKFEIKNGYLNVFLKHQGKELLDINNKKKKKEIQETNENQFTVTYIFYNIIF